MKSLSLFVLFLLTAVCSVSAQFVPPEERTASSSFNLGFGLGIDYGGFGMKGNFLPSPNVGLFAGIGYNLNSLGYNVGGEYRFAPDKRVCPAFLAMYGYNGVIVVDGASQYNATFYGPSIGLGLEIKSKKKPANFLNIELLVPFRSQEFTNALNALKNNPSIALKSEPLPIAFSIGYHIGF